jgi:hypothetical protein
MALPLGGLAIDWCKRVRRTGPSQILRFHMLMAFQYNVCRLLKYALTLLRRRERQRHRDKRETQREIDKREIDKREIDKREIDKREIDKREIDKR